MTIPIGPHIVELRDRVEMLEAENAELRTMLGLDDDVAALLIMGFTPAEARIVNLMLRRDIVTKDQVLFVSNPINPERRYDQGGNSANVHISRMRKVLNPLGCRLETYYGQGWRLIGKDNLRAAMNPTMRMAAE